MSDDDYSYRFDLSPINSSRTRFRRNSNFYNSNSKEHCSRSMLIGRQFLIQKFLEKKISERFVHAIFSHLII